MRNYFAKRALWQRVIALIAAYAIALSGLLANFGAAQAAAAAVLNPGSIICHTVLPGEQPPAPAGDTNGKACLDCCCGVGCIMTVAALPPPAGMAPLPQILAHRLAPPALAELPGAHTDKSHRARAPPLNA